MVKKIFEKLFIFGIREPMFTESESTLEGLKAGNNYFTSYLLNKSSPSNIDRVRYLALNGQNPRAVIVTCSDARISPERIFNAQMGDFFIIRTAGNVLGELELGSIEYAISAFQTDTIIVMGHENCGAIHSAIYDHEQGCGHIQSIINIIQPSIDKALKETDNQTEIIAKAEDYNIMHSVEQIKSSNIINETINLGKVKVVGAKYGISTGKVVFFD